MKTLLTALMVAVGMVLPLQAGMNAEMRRHVGHPLAAALVNFVVGLSIIATATVLYRVWPSYEKLGAAPWWAWLGGACGAMLVISAVIAAPHLGALLLIGCLVAGQMSASVIIDHFGIAGYPIKPVNWSRIVGVLFLVAGVALIYNSER